MFEKKCPICNNKFKGSEGQKCTVHKIGLWVLICKQCYETYAPTKEEKNIEFNAICNECDSTMQDIEVIDKGTKIIFFCSQCKKNWSSNEIKITSRNQFDLSDVTVITDKTKSEISLYYVEAQMVDTKVFVSKKKDEDFKPIETKEKKKPILMNRIQLEIELAKGVANMTTWNKKSTDYDVHDGFGVGYSLTIAFSEPDNVLMNLLLPIIRNYGFGSIPGRQWSHCHLDNQNPTNEKAEKILTEVTNLIANKLQKSVIRYLP
ncbi:MAG TPA: hypothetical protein VGR54_08810 [Nitrosopumilaceae archaeon]|nr:hypothetical protein [Nitrosopumilaceae archaeon]